MTSHGIQHFEQRSRSRLYDFSVASSGLERVQELREPCPSSSKSQLVLRQQPAAGTDAVPPHHPTTAHHQRPHLVGRLASVRETMAEA